MKTIRISLSTLHQLLDFADTGERYRRAIQEAMDGESISISTTTVAENLRASLKEMTDAEEAVDQLSRSPTGQETAYRTLLGLSDGSWSPSWLAGL